MLLTLLPLLATQLAASTPLPGPPTPATLESAYEAELRQSYRQSCMSEPGIDIAVRHHAREREMIAARDVRSKALDAGLAAALDARPIDVDRVDRALRLLSAHTGQAVAASHGRYIATLRRLSPADRLVFAPNIYVFAPKQIASACPVATPG